MYRLPTEAEWEYACRGGAPSRPFHTGNSLSSRQANFVDFRGRKDRTCAVGSYEANGFGLFDMHGNVWQWTADWFAADYYQKSPKQDPPGPATGGTRALRGGGWDTAAVGCRSAYRVHDYGPALRTTHVGFRVALLR